MIKEFSILKDTVEDYILRSKAKDEDDFKFMLNLSKIIINEEHRNNNYEYSKKYNLKKIDNIVSDFLNDLNQKYKEYYDLRKKDGTFTFDLNKESINNQAYSTYDDINNKRIIYIPVRNTIDDAFSIVHELFHDINLDEKEASYTRMFYTEGMSILGEILLEDYLVKRHVKDAKIPMNFSLYCAREKAIEVDFNINLLLEYLDDNYFDTSKIIRVIENYPFSYAPDLAEIISKIISNEELTLDDEQVYVIGTLIATYMYDRIKNNKNNIVELFELNEEIKNYSFEQVLDYLDIEYNNVDLNEESYKKLKKCYKKYIKSR